MLEEFVAKVGAVDGRILNRREKDDDFAFLGIGQADDGDAAFGFCVEAEGFVDGALNGFVGHHFTANF